MKFLYTVTLYALDPDKTPETVRIYVDNMSRAMHWAKVLADASPHPLPSVSVTQEGFTPKGYA